MSDPGSDTNRQMGEVYRNQFLREIEDHVEHGEWTRMCTQCGVCAASCPLGEAWQYSPQQIIMMIRAGDRDAVLRSDAMWMCTSCYSCVVRCPRAVPVTQIMHGLAHYADRLGLAPQYQPTRRFAHLFWNNLARSGRINETTLAARLYFMSGLLAGIKAVLRMLPTAWAMFKARRLDPAAVMGHKGIEDKAGLHKILARAQQLEEQRIRSRTGIRSREDARAGAASSNPSGTA